MVAIIVVCIYSIEAGGYKVFDSHARDMYRNSHSEGTCVLLEIPSMHKLVQYFQTLHRNEDIYIYSHTEKISAYVDAFLRPIAERLPSYIRDTTDFIQRIKVLGKLSVECYLVTLDVSSL